uniref:Uncharacterized protein n=1 Tax=Cacopsylla melanoneura TaxID=428564 RepID=A0A8D9F904_9HEMI
MGILNPSFTIIFKYDSIHFLPIINPSVTMGLRKFTEAEKSRKVSLMSILKAIIFILKYGCCFLKLIIGTLKDNDTNHSIRFNTVGPIQYLFYLDFCFFFTRYSYYLYIFTLFEYNFIIYIFF